MASATPLFLSTRRVRSARPRTASLVAAVRAAAGSLFEPLEGRRLLSSTLVSVATDGTLANGASGESSVSADGRYVVFSSVATNLVAGDGNSQKDVFLRDTQQNKTYLVSATTGGAAANGNSFEPIISGDGQWVAFRSEASNLVSGDTNGVSDIFLANLADPAHPAVTRVSVGPGGVQANGFSGEPTISFDGRFVAFSSFASNLASGDTNEHNDAFRYDRQTGAVVVASAINGTNTPGNGTSFDPSLSADGRFVSFHSDGTNLVTGDANGTTDVFLRDIDGGTTVAVSVAPGGGTGNKASTSSSVNGSVSGGGAGSGRYVVFRSASDNLTTLDTNAQDDVFLRDTQTGQTTLLSLNQARTASGHGLSKEPSISSDGHFASFSSTANDLIGSDANNASDIFVRDLQAGPITLISTNAAGTGAGAGASSDPYVSADGRFVSYTSAATDLVSADSNGFADVFVASTPAGPNPTPNPTPGPTPTPTPTVDTQAPTAAVAADQIPPDTGDTTVTFNVTYTDNVALNTVILADPASPALTVSGPNGFSAAATLVSIVGSGPSATATYSFAAPGGATDPADNGTYTVAIPAGLLKDQTGNTAAAGAATGSFALNIVPADRPDLIGQITSALPTAVLAGAKGSVTVKVTNQGQMPVSGPVAVTLYVSDDATFSANDTGIITLTKTLKLKTGKAKSLKFNFNYPGTLGGGNYFLISRVDSGNAVAEPRERNNTTATTGPIGIAPAFVDLQPTVTAPTGKLTPGGTATAVVNLKNAGNVPLKQAVTITLTATGTAGTTAVTTFAKAQSIKQGATKAVKIKFTVPSTLTPGQYTLTAAVATSGSVNESDTTNNSSTSPAFAIA